ncbi:MAG TPA: CotH kinase family protein [Paludibacter sp.]|nr:CotH kinase family protein [Paludibacter sp.]
MKNFYTFLLLLLCFQARAVDFTGSNLPIVVITTDNNPSTGEPFDIPDEPKVPGEMKLIYRPDGGRNFLSDQDSSMFLNYNGRIAIEMRGSSSQTLPKKPYGVKTLKPDNVSNNNVSLLGMPKENDWVLNSLAFDPSLVRDFLSYDLSRALGNYAPRGVYCEVVVNGDYKGLYVLMEKLKVDEGRINVQKMTTLDNAFPAITGGYVTKCDKADNEVVSWSIPNSSGWGTQFIHVAPSYEVITPQQDDFIYNEFMEFTDMAIQQDDDPLTGFPSVIDVPSFIDFMLMNEIASNPDGYQTSSFFHKDRLGKLRAGPIWDFNLTYGNDVFEWGYDRSLTSIWQFDDSLNTGPRFWRDLFLNPVYNCYLSKRWMEMTAPGQPLNFNVICNKIDQLENLVSEAAAREQDRWGAIGSHAENVDSLKTWLQRRIDWLTARLNNYQPCANVPVPPLVISKINYNPVGTINAESDSLEFIEIANNSQSTINLSGVYFRELGMTYRFPLNSEIGPGARIVLASNAKAFELNHGVKPFDQFSRHLSNKGEKLLLCDAFGNIIDQVEYTDSYPWPAAADGGGSYLELPDLNLDNDLATNWRATNMELAVDNFYYAGFIRIYPDPAIDNATVESGLPISSCELSDLAGRIVMVTSASNPTTLDVGKLAPNIYLVKIKLENGAVVVKKLVKK